MIRHPLTTRYSSAALFGVAALLGVAPARPLVERAALWGEVGHRMIAELAVDAVPAEMPGFFRTARAQLIYLNPEPDRWRDRAERERDQAFDGATTSDHYINLERLPASRRAGILAAPSRVAYADSLRMLGADPSATGMLPFRIIEMTQQLRSDFRRWRVATDPNVRGWIEQRIINDAGILGHYVADGSNPAHTTIHHNGWIGDNPNGFATDNRFHSRFESEFVQAKVTAADVRPLAGAPVQVFANVRPAVLAYLQKTYGELEHLYTLDKQVAFNARNESAEHKRFTAERLAAGTTMLRDLWWTAWTTSAEGSGT